MTTITIDRAVVEQALEALERARPLKADYTTLEYFEEAKRKHYAAMAAFRTALAQKNKATPPDEAAGLVDDLCLLHMGWKEDAEGDLYRAAWGRVIARAKQLKAQVGKGKEKWPT